MTIPVAQPADTVSGNGATFLSRDGAVAARISEQTAGSSKPEIVFQSTSSYDPLVCILLALGPIACIICGLVVGFEAGVPWEERKTALIAIGCSAAFIILLYLAILPRRIDVLSNGSIAVVSLCCITYRFSDVCRAYECPGCGVDGGGGLVRPKFKFATHLPRRVVVRRRNGKWDVTVSPDDPPGFVRAVESVVARLEGQVVEGDQ